MMGCTIASHTAFKRLSATQSGGGKRAGAWTIRPRVRPVLRALENWIVMPLQLSTAICQRCSFLSKTPQRKYIILTVSVFSGPQARFLSF